MALLAGKRDPENALLGPLFQLCFTSNSQIIPINDAETPPPRANRFIGPLLIHYESTTGTFAVRSLRCIQINNAQTANTLTALSNLAQSFPCSYYVKQD